MVSTRKKGQSNRRLLSQLDDFEQDIINGNAKSDRPEKTTVNEGTADQEFTVANYDSNPAVNGNVVYVKTLERCFNEKIDREVGNIVDTVEDKIQNTILAAIDSEITLEIDLVIRSKNEPFGQDTTGVMASWDLGEHIGITAPSENVSQRNNTLHVLNTKNETRKKTPDEVSEVLVPDTQFGRQPHAHNTDSENY